MIERRAASPAAVAHAAALLHAGKLVAFPTETVYGLGARADEEAAVRAIFAAKGRPATNPLIVHVPDVAAARALAETFPPEAEALARAFWPGPLTLVLERRLGAVANAAAAGGPTVAVRVPAHPVALALLRAAALPIAAPSANRSTSISPTTADHVVKSLGGRIDLVLDGGPTGGASGHGIESTIVDVSRSPAVLLRLGALPLEALRAHANVVDPGAIVVPAGERAAAPGSQERHYAPRARVVMTAPASVHDEVEKLRAHGLVTGALERSPATVTTGPHETLPADAPGYAAHLYEALHRLEDAGCDAIVIAIVPDSAAWAAVRDRLKRAAAPESRGE
ncbi:TsaC protein [Minicystis rosea]|nr:TsaC protein [Minicystis rosea]